MSLDIFCPEIWHLNSFSQGFISWFQCVLDRETAPTPVPLHSATTVPQPQQNTQIQSSGPLNSAATRNQISCSTGALSVPEFSETSQTPIIHDPPPPRVKH
jgi:hypothetical protein